MDKLKMHSPNFAEENIAKLAALFPNCITESTDEDGNLTKSIDFDLLRQELSTHIVEGPQERYHLNWPGKRKALITANAPIAKTLRPCREESVDFDTTENLFIEGDNLDALKLLQEIYLGKVKMIYIDPPYNTGKDFIYADNFAESTEEYLLDSGQKDEEGNRLVANTDSNGRFHSDWLSMMYSRLKLARNLLKDDGVILISIDDNEVHNLRKVCDEIFGEDNFVANIVWKKKAGGGSDAKYYATDHEYLLCYAKEIEKIGRLFTGLTDELKSDYKHKDLNFDILGPYKRKNLYQTGIETDRPNLSYPIITPDGSEVFPPTIWRWEKSRFEKANEEGKIDFIKTSSGEWKVYTKMYLYSEDGDEYQIKPRSLLLSNGFTRDGNKELKTLFNTKYFDYPKPSKLIKYLVNIHSSITQKDVVLDFFAGSATTAHSAMQLNAEDGGNRKFIMVQWPEACDEKSEAFKAGYKNIAEISKERIRRAGKKIKEENAITALNLDTGFRVLKVDSSNMADIYYTPDETKQTELFNNTDNIKDDRTPEDLLFQVLLDWGVDLALPIAKETIADLEVFFVDGNALAACFVNNGQITEDFCKELAKREPLRVVFRDSGFADDSVKINVEQIFKLMSPHTDVMTL